MNTRTRLPLLGLALAVAAVFTISCAREKFVASATQIAAREAEGITIEQAKMGHRVVLQADEGARASAFDASWYGKAKRPRILLLVNRRFAGDAALWRADTRFIVSLHGGKTVRIGGKAADRETRRDKVEARTERRLGTPLVSMPATTAERFRGLLLQPFLTAGCVMVDPDVIERIGQAAASREEGNLAGRNLVDVSTEAFVKDADWIIEAIGLPTGRTDMPFVVSAKVVDLHSRRVMAVQATEDMPDTARPLPGAPATQPRRIALEEQAEWLAGALSQQLKTVIGK